jgi:hypothetical protein
MLTKISPFMDFINATPDKPWSWFRISENPNITWEDIEVNPDKPWCWKGVSFNTFGKLT